jgi:hypothetical protein
MRLWRSGCFGLVGILVLAGLAAGQTVEQRLDAIERRLDTIEQRLRALRIDTQTLREETVGNASVDTRNRVVIGRRIGLFAKAFRVDLSYVEVKESNTLFDIGILLTNTDDRTRYVWLPRTYRQSTFLIAEGGERYTVQDITGMSEHRLALQPSEQAVVVFTFARPQGVRRARFVSLWFAPAHIDLSVAVEIPAPGQRQDEVAPASR